MARQLVTYDEASEGSGRQHTRPCSDCPWSRKSLSGWLGGLTAEQWLNEAHGEAIIDCHTVRNTQCAGAAIYRANVCKLPRSNKALLLKPDREAVFANPNEFKEHHRIRRHRR